MRDLPTESMIARFLARWVTIGVAVGNCLACSGPAAVKPGTKLAAPACAVAVVNCVRLVWVVTTGDCLICGAYAIQLRSAERDVDSLSTGVVLIGRSSDTLNIRRFLDSKRINAPITVWSPEVVERHWGTPLTPDLQVIDAAQVLWSANAQEQPTAALDALRAMRQAAGSLVGEGAAVDPSQTSTNAVIIADPS